MTIETIRFKILRNIHFDHFDGLMKWLRVLAKTERIYRVIAMKQVRELPLRIGETGMEANELKSEILMHVGTGV